MIAGIYKKYLLPLLLLFCIGSSPSQLLAQSLQQLPLDTLIRRLPQAMRSDEQQARQMIAVLEKRSLQEQHRHGLVQSLFYKAWLSYRHDPAELAIQKIDSVLQHVAGIEKDSALINFYILKGQCYIKKTQFGPALQQFNKALQVAEQRGDNAGKTKTLVSIGWAYMEDGKEEEAIRFFKEVLRLNPSPRYESRGLLLCNIAACYNSLGEFSEAASFAEEGIAVARARGNNSDLANGLNILARSRYKQGNITAAISLLKEAADFRARVADPSMLASDYLELANMYNLAGKPALAVSWARKAVTISASHNNTLKLSAAYQTLADTYEAMGDHKNAALYLKKVLLHKDSLAANQYNRAFARMQVEFETKKREAENLQLKQENLEARLRNSQQQRWLLLMGAGLLLLVATGVYISKIIKSRYRTRLAETKLLEQKQRTKAVVEAEEKERRRIAGDLHDGVGQLLAAASMHLAKVGKGQAQLDSVDELISRAATEVRSISHQVTPELLLHYGLKRSLEQEVARLNAACAPLTFTLYTHFAVPVKDDLLSLTLYRCFQELCANIIKHANATRVTVQLEAFEEEILLMVEDDGKGFEKGTTAYGMGLKNMQSRLELYDAQLNIDSTLGKGTTTIIKIPGRAGLNRNEHDKNFAG
ncbi:MAG: tetratricopeptide repeat-containing sensor histidine kinase [Chitinophagaceae bacterium]